MAAAAGCEVLAGGVPAAGVSWTPGAGVPGSTQILSEPGSAGSLVKVTTASLIELVAVMVG